MGVIYVSIVSIVAASSSFAEVDRVSMVNEETCQLAGQDRGSDRHSARLFGPARLPAIPEYIDGKPVKYQMPISPKKMETKVEYSSNCLLIWTAKWCVNCAQMKVIGEKLKKEGFDVFYIDFDENEEKAKEDKIASLPTVVVYTGSEEVKRIIGVNRKTKKEAEAQIREVLKKNEEPNNYDIY